MPEADAQVHAAVHDHHVHPVLHIVAPIAALGATWAARKALNVAYEKISGHVPPAADDPAVSFGRALIWTVISAGTAAVVEMVIFRAAGRMSPEEA